MNRRYFYNDYSNDAKKKDYSELFKKLKEKRETFCGIGTRAVKHRLNKLALSNVTAKMLRIALETEDANISAKKGQKFRDKNYEKKAQGIIGLTQLCLKEGIKVGYEIDESYYNYGFDERYIVYFNLPNCGQISWHTYMKLDCPLYDEAWDGLQNSTLDKLESAILKAFPDIATKKWKN